MAEQQRGLAPVTGTYKPPRQAVLEIRASVGFDRAMKDALEQAAKQWRIPNRRRKIAVRVEYEADVEIWNPGGIGMYKVILSPGGGG